MSTVNVLFVSSEDTADCKPSKAEILRGIVADKLTTAAQEILAVVERTVSGYEEEAAGLRQEIERQRKHLELLLQPRVTLCRIDDQIPVCDPAAGGAEPPEENEQQKYEPSWSNGADMETSWAAGGCMDDPLAGDRDAAGLLISGGVDDLLTGGDDMEGCLIGVEDLERQDILGHTEEEESEDVGESAEEPGRSTSHQDDLRVTDHQIPNTRSQCVTRNSRSLGPTVHLRVCLLKDSHTEVLKKGVLKSPMKDLRCPRGLQEPDFLDLLRSTFPQLTGQFDVFTTDGTKTLTPLKVRTLTPEEIKRSIKSRSAIYISTKEAKKLVTSTEQLPPPQRKDEATYNMRNDENGSHASSVEKVENNAADRLSSYSRWQQQIEREDDGEQRGFLGDFSALSSVLPAAESKGDNGDDDDDDEVDEDDRDDEWKPNKNDEELRGSDAEQNSSKTITKKQVERSGVKATRRKWTQPTDNSDAPLSCKVCQTLHGTTNMLIKHSWSHVDEPQRLCGVCGEHSESAEELRTHLESHHKIHNDMEDARSLDILGHAEEEDGEDEGEESAEDPDYQIQNISDQSVRRTYSRRGLLSLKVCLLKDTHTDVLKKGVLKCPMRNLKCPRGLQEPDFVDLLRSTFPQLTGQFDVFTTDGTKKLTPLNVRTLTPEEIKRSIKSALYISTKRADKSLTCTEQQPPLPSPQKKDRPHASSVEKVEGDKADSLSSNSRRRQQMETEEDGEQCGISDNFSALSSVRSGAESDGDSGDYDEMDEDDEDDECKPDKNNEELSKSKAESNSSNTIRHQRVGHSGVETKTRTLMQSSPKTMTDNSGAPLSCKVCQTLCRSMNMLIKHSWSHVDDPESLCGVCGEQSESVEELRRHFESHQKSDGCDIFLHASTLNKHASVHTGQRPYKCDVCHKAYRFEISLRKHLREHGENKPHKCDVCNKSFGRKQQLMIHSRTHTGEEPHRCKKSFTNFPSLSQHKFCRVGERFYSCLVCGKCFLTPKHLKQHAHIHTDRDKPYLCDICCKTFSTYENLKAHLRTHSKKKIICSECGKELSSQASLNRHMLIHTGERPYECSECGRTFNTQSILNNHLITHSGIKLFVCRVCGKSSARKGSLTVHMRTHTGEKPYQCTVCSRRFSQSHCVKTHMKRHQGEEKSALDGLKF